MISVHVRRRPDRLHLQLAYTDPLTGTVRTKSAGTKHWKAAERAAAVWESELKQINGQSVTSWDVFKSRFEDEHLADKPPGTARSYLISLDKFERLIGRVKNLNLIDASLCSQYRAKLQKETESPSTVAKNLRELGVALNWAASVGMIQSAPKIRKPRIGNRNHRGRPLSTLEFVRFLQAVPRVVLPDLVSGWVNFLKGLWLTGLRIEEARKLHWEFGPIKLDFEARRPRIIFFGEGQKNDNDETIPLTPDAARFFARWPDRTGFVFPLPTERSRRSTEQNATKTVSAIGQASGIQTGPKKHATAHDLRRTFGTRWAMRVHPIVLKTLLRHADLKTTLKYYVDLDCDQIADRLYTTPAGD